MVRDYKRKTNRGCWDEESMNQAVRDVLDGKRGYKLASKTYGVPQTTLERKVKKARNNENRVQDLKEPLGPIVTVFTKDEEQEFKNYLKEMEGRLFGLTTTELRKLAYELAVRNNKQNNFNTEQGQAGKDWLRGFLCRHPDLSLRKPENTSAARAAGFNKVSVGKFFELLGKSLDEHPFAPDRIYNCDETGVSVVPKTRSKVVAATGKKQVGALTSAERGTTITIEICFNAAGTYMPPMFIFPRKRMKRELMNGGPPGSWAECSDSGWITADIFVNWFKKFIQFTNASKENPVMLLLDGHATHVQNLVVIDEARKNGVLIICFPPHTTHKLQPADVGLMRPLSIYYDQAITAWLRSNPAQVVTQFQVVELFGQAFIKAATMSTALNAFKACGIYPYNAEIFTEADFAAAEATDIVLNYTGEQFVSKSLLQTSAAPATSETSANLESTPSTSEYCQASHLNRELQSTSSLVSVNSLPTFQSSQLTNSERTLEQPTTHPPVANTSSSLVSQTLEPLQFQPNTSTASASKPPQSQDETSFYLVSPKQLLPYPQNTSNRKRQFRRRGKTAIITASPYKLELEERQKSKNTQYDKMKKKTPQNKSKKKLTTKKTGKRDKKRVEDSDSDTDDTECLYCQGVYSESHEGWITCQVCSKWAHCGCAGVEDNDDEAVHICPVCESDDD